MTRLYYKDPTQALWMVKEFKVKFDLIEEDGDIIKMKNWKKDFWVFEDLMYHLQHGYPIQKIYISKESEHIFEPKKGDEGRWSRIQGAHYSNFNGVQWVSAGTEPTEPEIIMRNNKHFFAPLKEEV